MKIIVSQQDKKIEIFFDDSRNRSASWRSRRRREDSWNQAYVDKFVIAKADEFLVCVDKFIGKSNNVTINGLKKAQLEFRNVGLLTERVIRAIMLGLRF